MNIHVVKAGLQTTIQGSPFRGQRHLGVPAAGAADCLSLLLANRLVGKDADAGALEISLSGATFVFNLNAKIAVTGAYCDFHVNGHSQPHQRTVTVKKGDEIRIGPTQKGCRTYLAIDGQFDIEKIFGKWSTYQSASLGGYNGRALKDGDILPIVPANHEASSQLTPDRFIPTITDNVILRVTCGAEFSWLDRQTKSRFFQENWIVGQRMSRMGLELVGDVLRFEKEASMQSSAVFPGTIQCPPNGVPFLLGPDAQTTGGYPRISQVIRADRHLIGQLKPGSKLRLVETTPNRASEIYRKKLELLTPWLGKVEFW